MAENKKTYDLECVQEGFANGVAPGFPLSDKQKDFIKDKIPLARIGRPEDVAYCVKFLVSDQANYITGQTIHVNGGLAML